MGNWKAKLGGSYTPPKERNWVAIENRYVQGSDSLRSLAIEYKLPLLSAQRKYFDQGWKAKRATFRANVQAKLDRAAEMRAFRSLDEINRRQHDLSGKITEKVGDLIKGAKRPTALKALVDTLESSTEQERTSAGFAPTAQRIELVSAAVSVLDSRFPEQCAFITDPARLKGIFGTRRISKSYGFALHEFDTLLHHPGTQGLITGLTREELYRIYWDPILKDIDAKYKLGCEFNETRLAVKFPNGSRIYMLGVDSSEDQMKKALGQKYKIICIDEAQGYRINLRKLIYEVLQPTTIDEQGTLCLGGTPGDIAAGMFYELTKDLDPLRPIRREITDPEGGARWSFHAWSALQNPYVRDNVAKDLAAKRLENPLIDEVPSFQQQWLGKWTTNEVLRVYKLSKGKNTFDGLLPKYTSDRWYFSLSCDLGYDDPTALVASAWHDHDLNLYVLRAEKRAGLDVTAVADWVNQWERELAQRYDGAVFSHYVIDGASKQAVQELRKRRGIPWRASDKQGKADFIQILNAELILATIKLDVVLCAPLIDEIEKLVWEEKAYEKGTLLEDPRLENHLTDAFLYGWRMGRQFRSKAPKVLPKPGTEEYEEQIWAQRRLEIQGRQSGELDPFDDSPSDSPFLEMP